MIKTKCLAAAIAAIGLSSPAFADSFVNGGFETGTTAGWTVSDSAYRNSVSNSNLTPAWITSNDNSGMHTAIVGTSYVDPNLGATLGTTVYKGDYAIRVEDTRSGGYASVISQQVTNYTDTDIFFAWKAVFLGAHNAESAAIMKLVLRDDTIGDDLITRTYDGQGGGGGVDSRFSTSGGFYYTPDWQLEQLTLGDRVGHSFTLSLIASDCSPTAHQGYVYLDGFGSVQGGGGDNGNGGSVPEPTTLAMLGLGLAGLAGVRRRKAD